MKEEYKFPILLLLLIAFGLVLVLYQTAIPSYIKENAYYLNAVFVLLILPFIIGIIKVVK